MVAHLVPTSRDWSIALLTGYLDDVSLTGDLRTDVVALLTHHGHPRTAEHCLRVADEGRRIAARYGESQEKAERAGCLHDISAVIPLARRVLLAEGLGMEVLAAERRAPMLLHQRLSAAMAREFFGERDPAVLAAVACHTTLKANPSRLDMILFVADKLAWDQHGDPPWREELLLALEESLEAAALCYLQHLWAQRETLPAVHPWMVEAYDQLSGRVRD